MIRTFEYDKIPIVEVVNEIIVDAAKRGASDIHFDPYDDILKTRIRVDGILYDYTETPNSLARNMVTRIKIIASMNITENRLPQDGSIKTTVRDMDLDLRVSSLPTNYGEKIVIRILDYTMSLAGLETLGFSAPNLARMKKLIAIPSGIILITGATGTGKSTTLYSVLQRLNDEETNIITVEDPVEMGIRGVNQVQTNQEIGLDFATSLRSILRQDPDIIMIGEIRDTETAKIAVRSSITGHLVLSTLHTNNSLTTIERLLDMDVERYLLASALAGIVSQKLARTLCTKCRRKRPTNEYEQGLFRKVMDTEVDSIYEPVGCDECTQGYKGRTPIHEVLIIDQEIKDAISGNIRKTDLRELVYQGDVTTMLQDGLEKILEGKTSFEEIIRLIEFSADDVEEDDETNLATLIEFATLNKNNETEKAKEEATIKKEALNGQAPPAPPTVHQVKQVPIATAEESKEPNVTTSETSGNGTFFNNPFDVSDDEILL